MKTRVLMSVLAVGLAASACAGQESEGPAGPSRVQVQAEEYKFGGVPDTVPAGPVEFTLENVGQETHEFALARIIGDQSIDELVQLPGNQANEFIEQIGGTGAEPGDEASFKAELEAGRYGYVCFVETKDGEPHAALGMYGEFTVS
jgi:plastocyanin